MLSHKLIQILLLLLFGTATFQTWGASSPTSTVLPIAMFTGLPVTPYVNQKVQFTNTSTGNPTTWLWNFGDGQTGTAKDPTHSYASAGNFTVSLKATNSKGSSTISHPVTVTQTPKAEFTCTPSELSVGQQVSCKDTTNVKPSSWTWSFGDGGSSNDQNPSHVYAKSGAFSIILKVTVNGATFTINHNIKVNPVVATGPSFNLAQTLSDGAQRTTLAFSGLAMMTGNLQAQSFFPPGKVADYTGFQYLRDNDPDNMGHNTSFLTRVANNVIYLLNDAQFKKLTTLATSQISQINLYGYKRYPLMKAFRRVIVNDIPIGSKGLNLNAVKKASRELYLIDGQISFDRALLYAEIINSLDATQKAYLANMKGKGWKSWPNITDEQVKSKMSNLPRGTGVAVMTYASDLFSWYVGSIDADVYFCPERQGTYYGSFYIKDAPAIGHEGYSIDEQLTATAGSALSDSSKGYVTSQQAALMSSLVDLQKNNLYASPSENIVKARTWIATQLRNLLLPNPDITNIKAKVIELSGLYGDLDGANNYGYVNVFAQVYNTLTTDQKAKLLTLRKSIMSGKYADGTAFDYSVSTNYFLYSEVINDLTTLNPYVTNTDYLFFEP